MRTFICLASVILSAGCSYSPTFSPGDIVSAVTIEETRRTIAIMPAGAVSTDTGLLFYPGGLVGNHVYNVLLARFTEISGIPSVIVKMPANLAVFDIDAGLSVTPSFPDITRWIIAGHSLGGSMAASTVRSHPGAYEGLIFMDSYPSGADSLKNWPGTVPSLW